MLGKVKTLILQGVEGRIVEIEANLYRGLHKFSIVGLPDRSINESKERVSSAILNTKLLFPYGQLVVNLSPAFIEKKGTSLDLPICLAVILTNNINRGDIKIDLDKTIIIGELGLDGLIKGNRSAPAMVAAAKSLGIKNVILPAENYVETRHIPGIDQYPVEDLQGLLDLLRQGETQLRMHLDKFSSSINMADLFDADNEYECLKILLTREYEMRILGIIAAGRHSLLFDGPPGSGKSTLLYSYQYLLPELDSEQAMEVFKLHSLVRDIDFSEAKLPPFRTPHHSISDTALIGGGKEPTPGEMTLAHRGVLFLDEISEFSKYGLEALRQPMVDKIVNIGRASYKIKFPADFQLLATRNPCPCGWYKDPEHECKCNSMQRHHYQSKPSGAVLDRIDIKHRVDNSSKDNNTFSIKKSRGKRMIRRLKARIAYARDVQMKRYRMLKLDRQGIKLNSDFNKPMDLATLGISQQDQYFLTNLREEGKLTYRSFLKVAKLARTIADFDNCEHVIRDHILEAYSMNSY